jgi:hypothetical protein
LGRFATISHRNEQQVLGGADHQPFIEALGLMGARAVRREAPAIGVVGGVDMALMFPTEQIFLVDVSRCA